MEDNIFEAGSEGGIENASALDQIRQIESLAQFDPSFANSQEYKDLLASLQTSQQAPKTKAQIVEEDEDEEEEEEEDDDIEEEDEEEDDIDDVFGITKTKKKEKEVKLNFEAPKEMVEMLSSKYGITDASKFFSSVDTWRTQAQEGTEVRKEYDALSNDLQALPPDIRMAVELWASGEDHSKAFTMNQALDFEDDFKNQDKEGLVSFYLQEEYQELLEQLEQGDLDEDDFDDRIRLLSASTKRLFTEDKRALDKEREDYVNRQKAESQNMKKTAILSAENLSKAYPNFSKTEVNKIRNVLVEGKVEGLFMNADGTYVEDAAELVAYAMYGKKMLESVKKIAERKGESKANIKTVDSSPKTVKKQKASGNPTASSMNAVKHLGGMFTDDPYANRG